MKIIHDIHEMQKHAEALRSAGKTIAFVPTMGALHEGHLSLCRTGRKKADVLIMSIFVNPAQFAPGEDLDKYPRDLKADEEKARRENVDLIFYPEETEMYKSGHRTWVTVEELSEILCGRSRPTHFRGVTTIVTKLLNILKPHYMVMGQKDAQQAAIIQRMISDLNINTELLIAPVVREEDGLAMSSRNVYLTSRERKNALILSRTLKDLKNDLENDRNNIDDKIAGARHRISAAEGIKLDYLEARSWPGLSENLPEKGKFLIAGAIFLANVRLIDNIIIGQE